MLARRAADAGGRAAARARPRRRDLRLAQSARVQRRQVLRRDGRKLTDAAEEADRGAARRAAPPGGGEIDSRRRRRRRLPRARRSSASAPTSPGCASRSTARTAPTPASRRARSSGSARRSSAIGDEPDGTNINVGCGATDLAALAGARRATAASTSGSPSTATATACSPSTRRGAAVDGDQIVAILALDLGVDLVAVTQMTNLGFHALMARARHPRRHDRRRRPLRARGAPPRGRRARRRAVGPRHLPPRPRDRRRPRRRAPALRARSRPHARARPPRSCRATRRRKENVRVASQEPAHRPIRAAVERANAELAGTGRVLVRPSGTEPVVRVLAEAPDEEEAEEACASIAALVETRARLTVSAATRPGQKPGSFAC